MRPSSSCARRAQHTFRSRSPSPPPPVSSGLVRDGCRLDQDIPLRAHTEVRPHFVVPVSNQPQVIFRALGTKGCSRVFPDQTRAFHTTWRGGPVPPVWRVILLGWRGSRSSPP